MFAWPAWSAPRARDRRRAARPAQGLGSESGPREAAWYRARFHLQSTLGGAARAARPARGLRLKRAAAGRRGGATGWCGTRARTAAPPAVRRPPAARLESFIVPVAEMVWRDGRAGGRYRRLSGCLRATTTCSGPAGHTARCRSRARASVTVWSGGCGRVTCAAARTVRPESEQTRIQAARACTQHAPRPGTGFATAVVCAPRNQGTHSGFWTRIESICCARSGKPFFRPKRGWCTTVPCGALSTPTNHRFRARTLETHARAGFFRCKSIAFEVPDPANRAWLSAED